MTIEEEARHYALIAGRLAKEVRELKAELAAVKAARAWQMITKMHAEGADASSMTAYQLGKAIRAEITDKIPMHSREFALIDELVNRLDGQTKGFFVPIEWHEKAEALAQEKRIALTNELDDCKPWAGAMQMRLALDEQINALLDHCPDPECAECGRIVCPHKEPLHFHHDGCPACARDSDQQSPIGIRQ